MPPKGKTKPTEIPESLFGFIAWLLTNPRALMVGLGVGVLLIGAVLGLRVFGIDMACWFAPDSMRQKMCTPSVANELLSKEMLDCIEEARRNNRDWVILSATLNARLEDSPDNTQRRSEFRMQYTALALKDIKPGEGFFDESFESSYAKSVEKFYSSHEERPHGTGDKEFDLKFTAAQGDIETFSTGIDWIYKLPLDDDRRGHAGRILLGKNQDTVEYPNGPDSVCELRINVTSPTSRLRQVGEGAHRALGASDKTERVLENGDPTARGRMLSARWTNIKPNEHATIHFQWDTPPLNGASVTPRPP